MLIEPTPQDLHRDRHTPTKVLVAVNSFERVIKPELDGEVFEEAAFVALGEARAAGYAAVRFVGVTELIGPGEAGARLRYQYAYRFDAMRATDPIESAPGPR